tara:strand:+ start:490 stop:768 length:279 start_codon:yes stop_codon:yes gene_type:complete
MPKKNTIQDSILQFLATSETGEGYSVKEIAAATGRDMAYTRTSLNAMCYERLIKRQVKMINNKKLSKYYLFAAKDVDYLGKSKVIDPSIVSW